MNKSKPSSSSSSSHARVWIGAQRHSIGYVAQTGGICAESGSTKPYGRPYSSGDIVSVVFDWRSRSVEFRLNGVTQGIAVRSWPISSSTRGTQQELEEMLPLYAAVSLHGVRAEVKYLGWKAEA